MVHVAAISYKIPSRKLTNEDVIAHLDRNNPYLSKAQKDTHFRAITRLYKRIGAESRYVRNSANGEKAVDLILGAMDEALKGANMVPMDIDLLIFCGVGKGFVEPANAYFYAKARGMRATNCFDVSDACMSWIRALHIAYLTLRADLCRTVMIINGEFHFGIHDNWEIGPLDTLSYRFPMYTIGEAATATILVSSQKEWRFDYQSRSDLADLCTIPMKGYDDFVTPSERVGLNGLETLVSFGRELFGEGYALLGQLVQRTIPNPNTKRWYFPHTPCTSLYENNDWGVPPNKIYLKVFPRFGNVVSASIPVALGLAQEEGVLERGDPIALTSVGAGMVASVVQLSF